MPQLNKEKRQMKTSFKIKLLVVIFMILSYLSGLGTGYYIGVTSTVKDFHNYTAHNPIIIYQKWLSKDW